MEWGGDKWSWRGKERDGERERERARDQVLIICRDEKKVERKKFEA